MIDIKKNAVELAMINEQIDSIYQWKKDIEDALINEPLKSLYKRKKEIEDEFRQFKNSVVEICGSTGKTMDEIEV